MMDCFSRLFALSALLFSQLVQAQAYPVKPLRLIAPFPTGASQMYIRAKVARWAKVIREAKIQFD